MTYISLAVKVVQNFRSLIQIQQQASCIIFRRLKNKFQANNERVKFKTIMQYIFFINKMEYLMVMLRVYCF